MLTELIKSGTWPYNCAYTPKGKKSDNHWIVFAIDYSTDAPHAKRIVKSFATKPEAQEFYKNYLSPMVEYMINKKFGTTEEYQRFYSTFHRSVDQRLAQAKQLLSNPDLNNNNFTDSVSEVLKFRDSV